MKLPDMIANKRSTKILAKSLFKELRDNDYSAKYILGLTSELIGLVTKDLRDAVAGAVAGTTSSDEVRTSA